MTLSVGMFREYRIVVLRHSTAGGGGGGGGQVNLRVTEEDVNHVSATNLSSTAHSHVNWQVKGGPNQQQDPRNRSRNYSRDSCQKKFFRSEGELVGHK